MIDLCTLGTGGSLPMPDRGLSSLYVRAGGKLLLIDCGEGTQVAIRRLGWGFIDVDAILITHFHADHCGGLPGFLLSIAKAQRTEPVHIWGPVGLKALVHALRVLAPSLTFPLVLHELRGGEHFSAIGLEIDCFPLHHGVPCLGYKLHLHRPPAFDPVKARTLNIPLPLWKTLQRGESVEVNGCTIHPGQVTGEPRRGLSFLFATDTRPVPAIAEYGRDTDLMILEGMYGDETKRPQAIKNHHMIFHEAAELAQQAGTRQLLLTHYSTCIDDPLPYLPLAQAIFPQTLCSHDGMVVRLDYDKA